VNQAKSNFLRLVSHEFRTPLAALTERGRIDVSVEKKNGTVNFAVRDTGPGMPPDERVRIFKPFEQLERLESKHLQGFGLGLALVKEMVAVLNGEIELLPARGGKHVRGISSVGRGGQT
jgi:signal transduction histidine kinase